MGECGGKKKLSRGGIAGEGEEGKKEAVGRGCQGEMGPRT